jgi:large subunit ribosomal protein L4
MEISILNMSGKEVKKLDVPAYIFQEEVNVGLMHQLFVLQMANARQGNVKKLRRGEVNRTTAKVYRQKGTGRARHGARSAPIFVGGGRAHPPMPRKFTKDMPRKMRRKAIRCALSALMRDSQLVFVESLAFDAPKTKQMKEVLETIAGSEKALVVLGQKNDNVSRSVHNLPKAHVILASYLNIRDLLNYDKVVITLEALDVIQTIWGQEA